MNPIILKLKQAYDWCAKHPKAVIAFVSLALGAYLMWRFNRGKMTSIGDAVEVRRATKEIAIKQGRATELYMQGQAAGEESKKLEAEIAESKRRVVEIHQGEPMEGKTDDEIARAFTAAGF